MYRLLVSFNRIGDLTMATPLYRQLAKTGKLALLTRSFGKTLLESQSFIDKVFTLDHPNRGKSGLKKLIFGGPRRQLAKAMRQENFTEILIYQDERSIIQNWLATEFPETPIKKMVIPVKKGEEHYSQRYRRAAESINLDLQGYDPIPRLDLSPDANMAANKFLAHLGKKIVGIQMGSQRSQDKTLWKNKPNLKGLALSQWLALISEILNSDSDVILAFHGAPSEWQLIETVIKKLPKTLQNRCSNFTRSIPLELLPAILKQHYALITIDTGPAHIAAAAGCPILVFFGPSDIKEYSMISQSPVEVVLGEAPCMPCMGSNLYKTCQNNICLNTLSENTIWAAWQRLCRRIG